MIDRQQRWIALEEYDWLPWSLETRSSAHGRRPKRVISDVTDPMRYRIRLRSHQVDGLGWPADLRQWRERGGRPKRHTDFFVGPRSEKRIAPVACVASMGIEPSEAGLGAQRPGDGKLIEGSDAFCPHVAALLAWLLAVKQPLPVLVRMALLGLVCVFWGACKNDPAPFVFEAFVVDGENGNPAAGTDAARLQIGIREGDRPAQELEYPITDGQFDAVLPFEAFVDQTRIRVAIEGPTTDLVTAPPTFVPALTNGTMRVVTAAPRSCTRIRFDVMEAPRASFGMVLSGTFALLVGGTAPTQEQVEFLDALEWESRLFDEELSLSNLGPTRAASIDERQILVIPSEVPAFVFDMGQPSDRIVSVDLHDGAGPRSALVSVPGVGAMVVGGDLGGEAQIAVSLVESGGAVTPLRLSTPRSSPAAAALGADVLVVGGEPSGTAELLRAGATIGEPVASLTDGIRKAAVLVGDGQTRAILMGGEDDGGVVRQDTVRFDGCPQSCVATSGPTWMTARREVLQPDGSTLLIGGTDSRLVEEVRWSDSALQISPLLELTVPRAATGGIVLESGVFIVGGGDGAGGPQQDFEFCAPDRLVPL